MTCEIYCFLVAQSITGDNNWIARVALSPSSVRLFKQADIRQYLYDINIHYLDLHLSGPDAALETCMNLIQQVTKVSFTYNLHPLARWVSV